MLKLKIPPAVVVLLLGIGMWALNRYLSIQWMRLNDSYYLDLILLGMGGILGILGLIQFYLHSTSIDPHAPQKTTSLVTDGIYRCSRNPMYLALVFVLAGFAFYLKYLLTLIAIPLFIWYMNRFQIRPEEEIMIDKFGDQYREYMSEVRRWL